MSRFKALQNNVLLALGLLKNYFFAKAILFLHPNLYDANRWQSSRYAVGGKKGVWTAPIWRWIVDDYKQCKKHHINEDVTWPCSPNIRVISPNNIHFHPNDLNNFQGFGNYYQALGNIDIGEGTYIAPNVGIITANHKFDNLDEHQAPKDVSIGKKCWIGMNSVILPGVKLADGIVVGAGSVVTKSFLEEDIVIAGNPAKEIKKKDNRRESL